MDTSLQILLDLALLIATAKTLGGLSQRIGLPDSPHKMKKMSLAAPGQSKAVEETPLTAYFAASAQLRFVFKGIMFGFGYHSRTRVLVGIGFTLDPVGRQPDGYRNAMHGIR